MHQHHTGGDEGSEVVEEVRVGKETTALIICAHVSCADIDAIDFASCEPIRRSSVFSHAGTASTIRFRTASRPKRSCIIIDDMANHTTHEPRFHL